MSYDNTPYRTPPAYGEEGVQYNRFGIPLGAAAGPVGGAPVGSAPVGSGPAGSPPAGGGSPFVAQPPVGPPPWEAQAAAAWQAPAAQAPAPPAWGTPPGIPAQGGPAWGAPAWGPPATPRKGAVIVGGTSYECASWGLRVGSALLDGLLVMLVAGAASLIAETVGNIVGLVFALWNTVYLQGSTGQTLGKRVVGTQLVRKVRRHPGTEHVVAPGPGIAFLRRVAQILDALSLYIGYLAPLWTERRQTFGDILSQTVVIKPVTPLQLTLAGPNDQSADW